MAGWSFHYPPVSHLLHSFRSQFFQPQYFRLNIVSFDVQMNSAGVTNFLKFNMRVIWPSFQ